MILIREQIEEKLKAAFVPDHLEVINESYRHNVLPALKVILKL